MGDLLNPVYSSLNDLIGQGAFPTIDNQEIAFLREREQESRLRFTQPLFQPRIIHNYRLNKHLVEAQEATIDAYRLQLVKEIKVLPDSTFSGNDISCIRPPLCGNY